jgi:NADH-quinone oxidoreductase subunit A
MTQLVGYLLLFLAVGAGFIFIHLLAGKFIRPAKMDPEKATIYECGEPTIGSAWIQFDLRFYVVALLFVIFDVEVAFFFPWAVVFGQANALTRAPLTQDSNPDPALTARTGTAENDLLKTFQRDDPKAPVTAEEKKAAGQLSVLAFLDILVFFGVLLVGFAYLWKRGDLAWVRSTLAERVPPPAAPLPAPAAPPVRELVGAGHDH